MAYEKMDIIEACTYYSFKDDLTPEAIQEIKDAGCDWDEDGYNSVDGDTVSKNNLEDYIEYESAEFDDLECTDLLESWIGNHSHYLVFANGCRYNGASGYTVCNKILDVLRRPYEATFIYKNHIEGRALICSESSHDVPMGSTTVIIGLTDEEYDKIEYDFDFNEVKEFVEGVIGETF